MRSADAELRGVDAAHVAGLVAAAQLQRVRALAERLDADREGRAVGGAEGGPLDGDDAVALLDYQRLGADVRVVEDRVADLEGVPGVHLLRLQGQRRGGEVAR